MKINRESLFKDTDRVYWILFAMLCIIAVIALFSAGSTLAMKKTFILEPVLKQTLFIVIGVIIAYGLQYVSSQWIRIVSYLGLAASIVLLLLTYTSLGVEHNGAKRWLNFGFEFQPSELAKLFLIIVSGDLLSRIHSDEDEKKYFFIVLGITAVICGLILPENLSTAMLLAGVVVLMMILARVHFKYLGSMIAIVTVMLFAGYLFVEKHYIEKHEKMTGLMGRAVTWCNRVDEVLNEVKSTHSSNATTTFQLTDKNYQRSIAKVAIARGGVSPVGVLPGNSRERDYLPQAFADYIFAIIVEETGLVGAAILIFIYLAILFRACLISSRYSDYAAMLIVMGLALMITCQALVSMMVSVGIGPVTGQPLPMISRGGTSAIVTSIYFGIIMAVAREQNQLVSQQQHAREDSFSDVPDIPINV